MAATVSGYPRIARTSNSRACFVKYRAVYVLYFLYLVLLPLARASLMEVFRGDDDDKCSYKSAVTGNRA